MKFTALKLSGSALICLGALCAWPPLAAAQSVEQGAVLAFDVPAGSLESALITVSVRSGVDIKVPPELLRGVSVSAVKGTYSVQAALQELLKGTGLDLTVDGDRRFRITRASSQSGPERVTIIGRKQDAYSEARTSTATRTATDTTKLAQSVTILTGDDLKRHQVSSVAEALEGVQGITIQNQDATTGVTIRGLGAPILVDGLSEGFAANYGVGISALGRPVAAIERLEVLSGADAILAGIGAGTATSGVINVAMKRPKKYPVRELSLNLGAQDHRNLSFDLNDAIGAERNLQYRLVVDKSKDGKSPAGFDSGPDNTYLLAAGTYQGSNGSLTIGMEAQSARTVPGRLLFISFDRWVHEFSPPGGKANAFNNKLRTAFAEWSYNLSPEWKLQGKARNSRTESDYRFTNIFPQGSIDADPHTYTFSTRSQQSTFTVDTLDLSASRSFESDGLKNTLLFGGTYQRTRLGLRTDASYEDGGVDYVFPVIAPASSPQVDFAARHTSLFFQDQLSWNDLNVIASVTHSTEHTRNVTLDRSEPKQQGTSPSLGLLYTISDSISAYGNIKRTFTPQSQVVLTDGSIAKPLIVHGKELGLKIGPKDGAITGTISLFETVLTNQYQQDPTGEFQLVPHVKSRGLDANLSGQFTKQLRGYFSYNYVKIIQTAVPVSQYAPAHTARVLFTYDLTSTSDNSWQLTGGVTARSRYNIVLGAFGFTDTGVQNYFSAYPVASQAVWQAGVLYGGKNWKLGLTAKNLLGKDYYGNGGQTGLPIQSGRQMTVSLNINL